MISYSVLICSMLSNFMKAFVELCSARNKPDKVSTIIQDMEDLAQEEIDNILSYHSRCMCC